jgi:hypothetical protein
VAGHPLRPATRRRLGGPLPRQLADRPRAPRSAPEVSQTSHAARLAYAVLPGRWAGYPPRIGRSLTCYAPVRRSPLARCPRLACVKHAASVRPEPGSNSPRVFEIALQNAIRQNHGPLTGTEPNGASESQDECRSNSPQHPDFGCWINESALHISRSQSQLSNSTEIPSGAAFRGSLPM